jgi:CRP/FNR family transcriptional regulator
MFQPLSFSADPAPNMHAIKASCAACSMHQLCLPMGLEDADINRLDQIIGKRRRLARDERLYQMGEPFRNLYAVRFGHFKTYQINAAGEAQITGFQMAGELLGMDAISGERHRCDASWLRMRWKWRNSVGTWPNSSSSRENGISHTSLSSSATMAAGTEQCSSMA